MIPTASGELGSVGTSFLSDDLLKASTHNVMSKWISMAAAILAVYEWSITLDMEIRLIWHNDTSPKQKMFTKVLYLMNRYGVVADLILNGFCSYTTNAGTCTTLLQALGATTVLGLYLSDYILILRVCAVWKMNKVVILFLATTYIGTMAYSLTEYYLILRPVEFFTLLPFGGCSTNAQISSTSGISYIIIMLIYDMAMVLLMGYPTINEYRFSYGRTAQLRCVHDEGVVFYIFLLLVDVVSAVLQHIVPSNIPIPPIVARILRSTLATRTVLHLREYSREVGVRSTNEAISSIRFRRSRGEEEEEEE